MLFSTNSATALSGLLCDRAMMRIAFQSSPILSLPRSLFLAFMVTCMSRGANGSRPKSISEMVLFVSRTCSHNDWLKEANRRS